MRVLTQKDIKRIPVTIDASVTTTLKPGMVIQPDYTNDDDEYILPADEAQKALFMLFSGNSRPDATKTGKCTAIFADLIMVQLLSGEYSGAIAANDQLTAGTDGLIKKAETGDVAHGLCYHTDGDDRYILWSILGYSSAVI